MAMQVLLAFRPSLVSFWIFLIYAAITSVLVYVQETVPTPPTVLPAGLNLTVAMLDLQTITRAYHPFSSRENDRVRQFLLHRADHILDKSGITYKYKVVRGSHAEEPPRREIGASSDTMSSEEPEVVVFVHEAVNFVFSYDAGEYLSGGSGTGSTWTAQYFEDNSFYVYIRGKRDLPGEWWRENATVMSQRPTGGVLVNCHFDSVSTSYGATDNGVSCITLLQLLSYFTSPQRQPENGIVLLFNNAEEDGLLGARAFSRSPVLPFLRTFINLEGVGAGGRAMLFQATDVDVAKAYSRAPHPFGSILAKEGYDKGLVMSGTDYQIFTSVYSLRGLDVAFYKPRSRYHTTEDDARSTSTASIWHMLSAAMTTAERLSQMPDHDDMENHPVDVDREDAGVWFDILGRWFVAFPLKVLSTGSLVLLIVTPLLIAWLTFILFRKENSSILVGEIISSRLPLAVVLAIIFTIGPILVLSKVNPLIIYGNQYPIWAMSLSSSYIGLWLPMHGSLGDTRLGTFFWLFALSLVLLLITTVAELEYGIGAFYMVFPLHVAIFLSLILSLIERLALPARLSVEAATLEDEIPGREEMSASQLPATGNENDEDNERPGNVGSTLDAGETHTAVTRVPDSNGRRQTMTRSGRHSIISSLSSATFLVQKWLRSRNHELLPSSLRKNIWIVQFLLLGPVNILLIGSQGLASVAAVAMTGTDGSNLMTPWLLLGVFGIVFLLPLLPFIHRTPQHFAIFLFIVFTANTLYLGSAFPFSTDSRFKFIFQQTLNLDDGTNVVTLTGIETYLRSIINLIPDAVGAAVVCQPTVERNLMDCQYHSQLLPDVANGTDLEDLVEFTYTSADNSTLHMTLHALETRSCFLDFSRPFGNFSISGISQLDPRLSEKPPDGQIQHMQLWRQNWSDPWEISLQVPNEHGGPDTEESLSAKTMERLELRSDTALAVEKGSMAVTIRCLWSDANKPAAIPALSQMQQYMPPWAIYTKRGFSLVEVRRTFII